MPKHLLSPKFRPTLNENLTERLTLSLVTLWRCWVSIHQLHIVNSSLINTRFNTPQSNESLIYDCKI